MVHDAGPGGGLGAAPASGPGALSGYGGGLAWKGDWLGFGENGSLVETKGEGGG